MRRERDSERKGGDTEVKPAKGAKLAAAKNYFLLAAPLKHMTAYNGRRGLSAGSVPP